MGWLAYLITLLAFPDVFAGFVSAAVVAAYAEVLARVQKRTVTTYLLIGIIPMVPGAGIYHTAYALVSRNMEAFTLRGMQTLALAGAIALGILIGMGFPKLLVELGGHALEKLPLCHREARP